MLSRPKIIQVKGSNGSGKTTIAKQLIARSCDSHLLEGSASSRYLARRVVATILDDLGWCVIGKYPPESKMGGCDGIDSVAAIKAAIWTAHKYYPDYNILFEGMMISTIKSTFYNYLLGMEERFGIEPLFVILVTNAEACIKRLRGRGTMKDNLKPDNIRSKCDMVVRHSYDYDKRCVRWMDVDRVPKERMLDCMLTLISTRYK